MNFPAQGLAIIGPILFIVLMIAFPVIGVFGGWKRAAYWGGGNLVFYLLGLGIWAGAHAALGNAMLGWLASVIKDFPVDDLKSFAQSITAPIFFLIVVVAGNLFLLLNYYFWFKRVAKIRNKDDKANLENNTLPSKKYRIISMVAGGVGMPVLMLPTTLSATQAAMFVTTSAATRKNNAFANGLYNGLAKLSESFGGLSYYGITKSAEDFDALWAAQGLRENVEPGTIPNPSGEGTIDGTVSDVLADIFKIGIGNIIDDAMNQKTEDIGQKVTNLANSWNVLVDQQKDVLGPLMSSDSATKIIKDLFPIIEEKTPIKGDATFETIWGDEGILANALDPDQFDPLPVSSTGLKNIREAMDTFYTLDDLTDTQKTTFETRVTEVLEMMFQVE